MRSAAAHPPRLRLLPAVARCVCLRLVSGVMLALAFVAVPAAATPSPHEVQDAGAAVPSLKPKLSKDVQALEDRNKALGAAKLRVEASPTLENQRALAEQYVKAGVLDAAMDHFDAALKLDPHDVPSLDGSARIWREWGHADIALPQAYKAVYQAPDSPVVHNTLGTLLLKLGHLDAAREQFLQARTLAPSAAYPVNNLCYVELMRANSADAVRLCREAAAMDPRSHTARNNLALALALAGDVDGAVSAFESGSGSSPAIAAYNQGMVLAAAGQLDRALAAFAQAREADPAFAPAFKRLKQLSIHRAVP